MSYASQEKKMQPANQYPLYRIMEQGIMIDWIRGIWFLRGRQQCGVEM
jgi:hypothetical protein